MSDLIASVVMPVRNEARHIERSLSAVLAQDVPDGALEVLVVDGMSDDATRTIVRRLADGARFPVRILENADRIASTALNLGFAAAACDVVVRVDGHCAIPSGYVRRLVDVLARTGAAAAGGAVRPSGNGPIAAALRSRWATGGAAFRHRDGLEREVDTVPFPAYRKADVLAVGGFDEVMVRNQDDDLHQRLRRAGKPIVLVPDLAVVYACRDTLRGLFGQYFQYGVWKVVGLRRRGRLSSWRALGPPALVLWCAGALLPALAFAALATWHGVAESGIGVGGVALIWFFSALGGLANASVPFALMWSVSWLAPRAMAAVVTMHIAYGLGFWWGALRLGRPPRRPE